MPPSYRNHACYPSAGLLAAIDNGTAAAIASGETRQAWLRAVAYQGLTAVSGVSPAGNVTGGRADGSGG